MPDFTFCFLIFVTEMSWQNWEYSISIICGSSGWNHLFKAIWDGFSKHSALPWELSCWVQWLKFNQSAESHYVLNIPRWHLYYGYSCNTDIWKPKSFSFHFIMYLIVFSWESSFVRCIFNLCKQCAWPKIENKDAIEIFYILYDYALHILY